MKRDTYLSAKALRAFRDGSNDQWDWAGAMMLADALDDFRLVRRMLEGVFLKGKGKGG